MTGSNAAPIAVVPSAIVGATQFDITGFMQRATLGCNGAAAPSHCGGTITVNNHVIVVPDELTVILPANALSWAELFTQAPAPYGPTQTGLAMSDVPTPITTYEVNVIGNRVVTAGGSDRYIAGLIHVSQNDLNNGAGYINFIDYNVRAADGTMRTEMRVGGAPLSNPACVAGTPGAPNAVAGGPGCTGTRVQINDPANASATADTLSVPGTSIPSGRYGRAQTDDARFTVDQDNPTILAGTGYPMCLPRGTVDPSDVANTDDPECPRMNRYFKRAGVGAPATTSMLDPTQPGGFAITTTNGGGLGRTTGYVADPTKQIPIELGDYITYAGGVMNDTATPTAGPAGATTHISAHTITDNFAAYTQPNTNPAYVMVEVALIGTGGLTVFGAGEAAFRTRFEGMSTDPSRNVHVYGNDLNPATGAITDRDWGYISPDPGPPAGAVEGRWRLRPPCKVTPPGAVSDRSCATPILGNYIPVTREVRAVIDNVPSPVSNDFPPGAVPLAGFTAPISATSPTAANGIVYGQYHAPINEYIFPENIPGSPIVANNFEAIPFLAYGGYTSSAGTQAAQLNPWPGVVAPPVPTCAVASTGGPYTVASGATQSLVGNVGAGATTPVSTNWAITTPGAPPGSITAGANTTTATYTAPVLAPGAPDVVETATFTATNLCGVTTAATTITVKAPGVPPPPPPALTVAPAAVLTGNVVTVTATSAGATTFAMAQTAGAQVVITQAPPGTFTFTAPSTPGVLTFNVTATNATGSSTTTRNITVTASIPTDITITKAEYRISKQRLIITATYAPIAPGAATDVLRLMPYLTTTGTTFDPSALGAAVNAFVNAGGTYTLTLVGAPQPACGNAANTTPCPTRPIVVQAFPAAGGAATGQSVATPLDTIRT